MSSHVMRRTYLLIPVMLVLAACQDTTAPRAASQLDGLHPRFAQGDAGIWTVNSLADPGDGTCDDTECTLREAIASASSQNNIVFASGLQGDIQLTAGRLVILWKDLAIDGGGRIAVDAQHNSGVIYVQGDPFLNATPVVRLAGLTLKNGASSGGGGLLTYNAELVTVDNVTLLNNSTGGNGGGIYADLSTVTVLNSRILGNSASFGGGIYNEASAMTVSNTTIAGNTASTDGGGIYNHGALTVTASTLSANQTFLRGGGIFNALNFGMTLTQSTVSNNHSTFTIFPDEYGDGIHNLGTVNLRSTTIALNGDFALVSESGAQVFNINNSIIQGFCRATIVSNGHNLADFCLSAASTDVIVTQAQMFTEVMESQLKDNGGPTKTHALIVRGRAADAGYCPGETFDQRGFTRPVDDALMPNSLDACDIGPYELQAPFVSVADLMVSQGVDKTSVKQGDLLTYIVRVQNLGPQTAPNVVLSDVLSSGVTFYSASSNKGTFTAPPRGETGAVTWSLGNMLNQANEVAQIAVTVLVKGNTIITNTATASGNVVDPNPSNNSAAITVSVVLSGKTTGGGTGGGGSGGGGGGGGNPHR